VIFSTRHPLLTLVAAACAGALGGLALGLYVLRPLPSAPPAPPPQPVKPVVYIPTSFAALPGWNDDHVSEALGAFEASCQTLANKPATDEIGSDVIARPVQAWQQACAGLAGAANDQDLRARIERLFTPYAVAAGGREGSAQSRGLFTGYYEADLRGSFTREGPYQYPIYGVPQDLVTVDLTQFIPDLPSGVPRQLVGHIGPGAGSETLLPYYTRQQIDHDNVLAGNADVLVWADDPVAVHILHIQGSGRVTLPDGRQIHVGYAGNNGRAFRGIGSILIKAGVLKPNEATMDHVRTWLRTHPDAAAGYMDQNARYIFFRANPLNDGSGPIGALGVSLTANRSLAVDPQFIPLGAPVWLDTTSPDGTPIRRLVLAQDTGAAITGPVRGDLFWGHGEAAFAAAARMHSQGHYFVLVPAP
jgi:membrane-bound lytic murein transglycosylase A